MDSSGCCSSALGSDWWGTWLSEFFEFLRAISGWFLKFFENFHSWNQPKGWNQWFYTVFYPKISQKCNFSNELVTTPHISLTHPHLRVQITSQLCSIPSDFFQKFWWSNLRSQKNSGPKLNYLLCKVDFPKK